MTQDFLPAVLRRAPNARRIGRRLRRAILLGAWIGCVAAAAETIEPVRIAVGQSVEIELSAGVPRSFDLEVGAGEYVQVVFSPRPGISIRASLEDPAQRTVASAEIAATQVLCGITDSAGLATLSIELAPASAPGRLTVEREIGRPARPGDPDHCAGDRAYWQGRAAERRGEIAAALEGYESALASYRKADDLAGQVQALFRSGRALGARGGPGDDARERTMYDQALPLAERLADLASTDLPAASACANLWGTVGRLHLERGDSDGAQAFYDRAVAVARAWPDDLDLPSRLKYMADAARQAGDRSAASAGYLETLALAGKNPVLAAQAEIGLGQIADRLEEALAHFDVAAASVPESLEIAFLTRHERCVALSRFGALGEALQECQTALLLACATSGAKGNEAASLNNLGSLYVDLGSYDKAAAQFEQAETFFRSFGETGNAGDALLNRGIAEVALGRFDPAEKRLEEALAIARDGHDDRSQGVALVQLGRWDLLRPNGDPERARGRLSEALELATRTRAADLEADARLELSSALDRLGRSDEALAELETASGLAATLQDPIRQSAVLTRRAEILLDRGALDAALAAIDEAVRKVDALRAEATSGFRASFLARRRRTFELQVEILMRLHEAKPGEGYDVRAFEASESARARSLLDLLAERRAGGEAVAARALSASQIRAALGPGELLLEFLRSQDATFLFAVRSESLAAFRLDARAIGGTLRNFTGALADPRSLAPGLRLAGSKLYRALLGPVDGPIAEARRLIVAADGDLYDLPFETLVAPVRADAAAGFLIERLPISYVPSASILARLGDLPLREGPDFVGFAAPNPGGGLPALPKVEDEVLRIAALFPGRSRTFLGAEATEGRFRAELPAVGTAKRLHFAAHGYLSEDPEQMGIHLSPDPARRGDGLLQAFEILGLDLHADLVVLSACETARGQRVPGEGTLGLPRAFFYAGAKSVVVSLWRAEDRATAALMESFYRALAGGADKAEALRRAKLDRLAVGDVPRQWAPFVLVGSPVR